MFPDVTFQLTEPLQIFGGHICIVWFFPVVFGSCQMAESSALSARNRHNITGDNFTFQSIRNQDLKKII